jgi:phosphomannomutase
MVRDKDGISAAVVFADLAAQCRASGISLWDRLGHLYRHHGLWVSTQKSVVRPGGEGAREIADAMERLSGAPPEWLGRYLVTETTDYREGAAERPRYLPTSALVEFALGEHGRALIRPSGTEPKIKVYVDLNAPPGSFQDVAETEAQLLRDAAAVAEDVAAFAGLATG